MPVTCSFLLSFFPRSTNPIAKAASFRVSFVLGGSQQLGQRRIRNDRSSLERSWLRVSSVRIPQWSLGIGGISGQNRASGPQPSISVSRNATFRDVSGVLSQVRESIRHRVRRRRRISTAQVQLRFNLRCTTRFKVRVSFHVWVIRRNRRRLSSTLSSKSLFARNRLFLFLESERTSKKERLNQGIQAE